MSGYLFHLASRAIDAAPVIKPRLPSWFEPPTLPLQMPPESVEFSAVPEVKPSPRDASPAQVTTTAPGVNPVQPVAAPAVFLRQGEPITAEVRGRPEVVTVAPPMRTVERELHSRHEVVIERRVEERLVVPPSLAGNRGPDRGEPLRPETVQVRSSHDQQPPALAAERSPMAPSGSTVATPVSQQPLLAASALVVVRPTDPVGRPPATALLVPKPLSQPGPPLAIPKPRMPMHGGQAPAQSSSEAPSITITIGRVEVRTVTAQPAPPHSRRRVVEPLMSLDEYLKQKDGRSP